MDENPYKSPSETSYDFATEPPKIRRKPNSLFRASAIGVANLAVLCLGGLFSGIDDSGVLVLMAIVIVTVAVYWLVS